MKKYFQCTAFVFALFCGALGFHAAAEAANRPTLGVTFLTGDWVEVRVVGEPNSPVALAFFKPGATTSTTLSNLGTTDANGNLTLNISSGLYSIPQAASAAVTVQGMQSPAVLWPEYSTSRLTLTPSSAVLSPGQYVAVNASGPVYVLNAPNNSVVTASTTDNQVLINGLRIGTTQLTVCQSSVGCLNLPITVMESANTPPSNSSTTDPGLVLSIPLHLGQTFPFSVWGSGVENLTLTGNSNPNVASASTNENTLTIKGQSVGQTDIRFCRSSNSQCGIISVTVGATALSVYTFPFVSGVKVQPAADRTMLTWSRNPAVITYDGYIIYRSEEQNVRGAEIARLDKNQTSYYDATVRNTRTYYTPVYYWGGAISNADKQVALQ